MTTAAGRTTAAIGQVDVFRAVFFPRSVAVVGATPDLDKTGGRLFAEMVRFGFRGALHPVHPVATEILGRPCYRTVKDIPGEVDRAVVLVPPAAVPQVIRECVAKQVRVAQILTAGFGELGAAGRAIEAELLAIARAGGLRLIGPNCMGTYCPASGLTFTGGASPEPGVLAVVSQSGGLAIDVVERGAVLGIRYSKVVSVGNCIDLDHVDFLEYLRDDPDTAGIGIYVESVRDGSRFLRVLRDTASRKPVIAVKGGRTTSGAASVSSHTGTFAGSYEVWRAVFRQAGVLEVRTMQELINVMVGLQFWRGQRPETVAMLGNGGGITVLASDACEELGLAIGDLTSATARRLTELDLPGAPERLNPLELPADRLVAYDGELSLAILDAYCRDPAVGAVILHVNMAPFRNHPSRLLEGLVSRLTALPRSKAIACVLRSSEAPEVETVRAELQERVLALGIPVFRYVEDALFALAAVKRLGRATGEPVAE